MKFEKYAPTEPLKPYIKYFVVSETALENYYKVFPSTALVIGFQYKGRLAALHNHTEQQLSTAGITGIADTYKTFKSTPVTGSILVYFTETGFIHFASQPAHELFNVSIALNEIWDKNIVEEVEEKIASASSDTQRIKTIEHFLISRLKNIESDKLILEAVKLIYQSGGTMRINELIRKLYISQSPFEKRFRKVVGTSAKKFATIIRFNTILSNMKEAKTLSEICYENNFFDEAHFSNHFKQFTGDSPENFRRRL